MASDDLLNRVIEYVQVHGEAEEAEVTSALAEARTLVAHYCGSAAVPDDIKSRAIVEVTAELFHRKSARNGVMDLAGSDLAPFRIRNDPMKAAYPLLTPYVGLGIA